MPRHNLKAALKSIRKSRGLSQEDFSDVSSRTYLSSLERGLKSPTLNKLEELCEVLQVHPLTLLTLAYSGKRGNAALLDSIKLELESLQDAGTETGKSQRKSKPA